MRHASLTLLLLSAAGPGVAQEEWARFRGPNGSGVSRDSPVPVEWSDANYLWRVELAGEGHGSPTLFGARVYVLTGDPDDASVTLLCHDVRSGRELWRARQEGAPYPIHAANSFASTTPAADSAGVYVSWATAESLYVAAYTHDGERLWRRAPGPYASSHGFASSPVLAGGLVCLVNDQREAGSVIALDRATGDAVWNAPRPGDIAAYATPCIVKVSGRDALVTQSTASGMSAIDAATGDTLWQARDVFPSRCVSSPVVADGLVWGTCGEGGGGRQLVAVSAQSGEEAFRLTSGAPYVPTPLAVDGLLILWHDRGTIACLDRPTREKLWERRVGGQYFASPVCAGDAVYNVSTDGEVVVVALRRDECRVLARNNLGEPSEATPAIAGGRMYLRTRSSLMCVGPEPSDAL